MICKVNLVLCGNEPISTYVQLCMPHPRHGGGIHFQCLPFLLASMFPFGWVALVVILSYMCPSRLYVQHCPPHYCQPGKEWNARGVVAAMLWLVGAQFYLVGFGTYMSSSQVCTHWGGKGFECQGFVSPLACFVGLHCIGWVREICLVGWNIYELF